MTTRKDTGRLTRVDRLNSSRNGNPTYRITLDGERTYKTQTDASVGYGVANYKSGRVVVLTMTAAGRVTGMTYENGERA